MPDCRRADGTGKTAGMEITKAEAEAYMAELENSELDAADLDKVAGGYCLDVDVFPGLSS